MVQRLKSTRPGDGERALTSAEQEIAMIRRGLKHITYESTTTDWLDTRSERLNAVLGSQKFGIPYGKIIELFGQNSNGKSLVSLLIGALAQRDGAKVAVVDLENSYDNDWAVSQGIDIDHLYLFRPQIGKFPGDKELRLQTAQELFLEVEEWMRIQHEKDRNAKMLVIVDSTAAILVEEEAEAGLMGQNFRTSQARATFLQRLLRRWVGLAQNYNAMMIFINHLLIKPGVSYGSPKYTPGGWALKFYASIRVEIRRGKNQGRLIKGNKLIGIGGTLVNVKNKAGGGSLEAARCGFTTKFGKREWKFPSIEEMDEKEKPEKPE